MDALYFDCFAGASGDMIVGALVDVGVNFEHLKRELSCLNLEGVELTTERVRRCGITATKFHVSAGCSQQPHRTLRDIQAIISAAPLSEVTKARALRVFDVIAEAEAKVHG